MNSLIRYEKSHYTSDFIKDNPIPDIDNEKPTKEDLKRRLQQIKQFTAPTLQEISEITKTEVYEQRELTLVQTENILTQIFHNKSFQMFVTYPDDQQLANYSQYIPYPMCFSLILARFYQNMSKHIDIKILNDIDYLDQPQAEYYAQLKKYLINNKKQSNSQNAIQSVQSNSISDAYKKIYGNFPQNSYINHYVYLDELLADLLQIGINCCSYNRQSQQFRDIGFQLIKTVINSFKTYDFPAFYQFKLKNFTDEEIKAIIESQQQHKRQTAQDEMTTLQSTIMPQLQETTVVQSTIIGGIADSADAGTSGVLGTNQQAQQVNKVHFEDSNQKQQNSGDMKVADLVTDADVNNKDDLIKTVQTQLDQVNQDVWQGDDKFMEMTNYADFDTLDKNQLQETTRYIQEHFM